MYSSDCQRVKDKPQPDRVRGEIGSWWHHRVFAEASADIWLDLL